MGTCGVTAQEFVTQAFDQPCSVATDSRWTPQEKFVWDHVCRGEPANFNEAPGYGGPPDPDRPASLPKNRIIRSIFIETILLKEPYQRALSRRTPVTIIGARYTDPIELHDAELKHPLWFIESIFEKAVNLSRIKSSNQISFDNSKFLGGLNMSLANVDSDVTVAHNFYTRTCRWSVEFN
jgi:hypothetical protein